MVQDGKNYMLQKANVSKSREFWRAWRTAGDSFRNLITLKKEAIHGVEYFFAYRLLPEETSDNYGVLPVSYVVNNLRGLLPYQSPAVASLCDSILRNGVAVDGSDTGLGKTYTSLGACRELNLLPAIVCRKSGIAGWKRACSHFGIVPEFIVNWEVAKNGRFRYARRLRDLYSGKYIYRWNFKRKTVLIFDEIHMACNVDSQNHALWISSKGIPGIYLSATFADRPSRLAGLMHMLGIMEKDVFYEWLKSRGHFVNKYNQVESLSSVQDMKFINKMLYPRFGCRLTYKDPQVKSFFPEAVYQTEVVSLSAKSEKAQNELYAKTVERVAELQSMGMQAQALVANLRYRQASELFKAEVLAELSEEYRYEGKSVVIFVNFLETLSYLARVLNTKSLIFGSQDRYISREKVINDFQDNRETILISMVSAGGQSIDLHDLSGNHQRISLVCPTYNPIDLRQVLGRTYRAGAKSIPIMKLVYAGGTIEEKVAEKVNQKLDNISALMDGDLMEPDLFNLGVEGIEYDS